ncbi:MAG: hypothetical protein KDB43_11980, partial [Nocardioidaceae bacterium]|nr:hypothetical protein [Nocardioidaceae bacterium]
MQTTTGTAAQVTDAVLHITALRSGSEIDRATSRLLADVIGCDDLLHTRVDLTGEGTSVRRGPALVDDGPTSRSLATLGALHPAVASYLVPGDDRSPRRISDVSSTRTWLGGPVYQEVFAARRERYQLSLVTALSPTCGTGWVLTRAARDFTDDDVERAAWLLPTLVALAA